MFTFTPSSNQTNNSKDGLFRENLVSNELLLKVAVIRRLANHNEKMIQLTFSSVSPSAQRM